MSYCSYIEVMQPEEKKALHKNYHDNHYGFPIHDDNELFGRLIPENVPLYRRRDRKRIPDEHRLPARGTC